MRPAAVTKKNLGNCAVQGRCHAERNRCDFVCRLQESEKTSDDPFLLADPFGAMHVALLGVRSRSLAVSTDENLILGALRRARPPAGSNLHRVSRNHDLDLGLAHHGDCAKLLRVSCQVKTASFKPWDNCADGHHTLNALAAANTST